MATMRLLVVASCLAVRRLEASAPPVDNATRPANGTAFPAASATAVAAGAWNASATAAPAPWDGGAPSYAPNATPVAAGAWNASATATPAPWDGGAPSYAPTTAACAAPEEGVCFAYHSRRGRDVDEGCCAHEERAACAEGWRYSSGGVCDRKVGCPMQTTCCTPCEPGEACESKSPVFGRAIQCAGLWGVLVIGASFFFALGLCFLSCCCFHWVRWRQQARAADRYWPDIPVVGDYLDGPGEVEITTAVCVAATSTDLADARVVEDAGDVALGDGAPPVASASEISPAKIRPV